MNKNQKIEEIIVSRKSIHTIDPNPYLYSKIINRIKDKSSDVYEKHPVLVWMSMSVLTLFIAVNIYVITSAQNAEPSHEINSLMNAYGLNEQGGLNYE